MRSSPLNHVFTFATFATFAPFATFGHAQSLDSLVMRLGAMSAVTGMEDAMADSLLAILPAARRDRAGNVVLEIGSGAPVKVAMCPMDEVGYVVGDVNAEGYLTLRRVGTTSVGPLYDQFLEGQRVTVFGRRGAIPGVVGVKSTHLTRGRPADNDPPFSLDNAYVDVGASSAQEAMALGITVLSPVTRAKRVHRYGPMHTRVSGPWIAQRAACAALIAASRATPSAGTVVIAFTARRHFAHDGAAFVLSQYPGADAVLLGDAAAAPLNGPPVHDTARVAGTRVRRWSLPGLYALTPSETVDARDVAALATMLGQWFGRFEPVASQWSDPPPPFVPGRDDVIRGPLDEARRVIAPLIAAYGPAGREDSVRALVMRMLPAWAQPTVDTAGNVWVWAGPETGPPVVFVAHMDEIGFSITGIRADGQLLVRALGGFFPSLFEAEPALIHTAAGDIVPAVFTLRDSVGAAPRRTPASAPGQAGAQTVINFRVDPGTGDSARTRALGIRAGDVVTMPKAFVPLAGTRATGRSFDDRVGVAAQILAMRRLNVGALRRRLLFVFSTREEGGLLGARAVANQLREGAVRVHALDTFVSADAPLEIRNFAYAPLGRGAVARAVDNSSVTPPALLDSLVALARARHIPLQVGTTNGGNDGSVFTRWGVPDVAIGWPLRYAHSPAEVIDLRDLVALADITQAIAERW